MLLLLSHKLFVWGSAFLCMQQQVLTNFDAGDGEGSKDMPYT